VGYWLRGGGIGVWEGGGGDLEVFFNVFVMLYCSGLLLCAIAASMCEFCHGSGVPPCNGERMVLPESSCGGEI